MTGDNIADDTWEILNSTVDGQDLTLPLIAFKRRKKSNRLDHIVKVNNRVYMSLTTYY